MTRRQPNLRRLVAHAHAFATELHGKASAIANDGDLSDAGRAKATTKHVVAEVARFRGRIAEETVQPATAIVADRP